MSAVLKPRSVSQTSLAGFREKITQRNIQYITQIAKLARETDIGSASRMFRMPPSFVATFSTLDEVTIQKLASISPLILGFDPKFRATEVAGLIGKTYTPVHNLELASNPHSGALRESHLALARDYLVFVWQVVDKEMDRREGSRLASTMLNTRSDVAFALSEVDISVVLANPALAKHVMFALTETVFQRHLDLLNHNQSTTATELILRINAISAYSRLTA
ncbi:MAG: hypothetical protein E6Q76_07380 [Rhizobium sp.]|nr:MAG: hypothetical protein E6Q76_07380 [Rhizobium sp.]